LCKKHEEGKKGREKIKERVPRSDHHQCRDSRRSCGKAEEPLRHRGKFGFTEVAKRVSPANEGNRFTNRKRFRKTGPLPSKGKKFSSKKGREQWDLGESMTNGRVAGRTKEKVGVPHC